MLQFLYNKNLIHVIGSKKFWNEPRVWFSSEFWLKNVRDVLLCEWERRPIHISNNPLICNDNYFPPNRFTFKSMQMSRVHKVLRSNHDPSVAIRKFLNFAQDSHITTNKFALIRNEAVSLLLINRKISFCALKFLRPHASQWRVFVECFSSKVE